jgi:hypothetical protein
MAKNKTEETAISVDDFISKVDDEQKRKDSYELIDLMQGATGFEPKMWGPSIIGFGSYHYKYDSGHEGDICLVGFSPRKAAISLYISGFPGKDQLLQQLGKFKAKETGGCIYVKKMKDIDAGILTQLVINSVKQKQSEYPD